jgi:hypothetical protein
MARAEAPAGADAVIKAGQEGAVGVVNELVFVDDEILVDLDAEVGFGGPAIWYVFVQIEIAKPAALIQPQHAASSETERRAEGDLVGVG